MEIKFFEDGKEVSTQEVIINNINKDYINIIQCCVDGMPAGSISGHLRAIKDIFKTYNIDIVPLAIPDAEHQYIFNQLQIKGDK